MRNGGSQYVTYRKYQQHEVPIRFTADTDMH